MVRILVDDDVVTVPEPAVRVAVVVRCDAEPEAAEAEAVAASAFEPVDVVGAEVARETPMRPGMIEVVVRVAGAGVVSDPLIALGMHVRGVGVPWRVGEIALRRGGGTGGRTGRLRGASRRGRTGRLGAVRRDMPSTNVRPGIPRRAGSALAAPTLLLTVLLVVPALLRHRRERTAQQHGEESSQLLHATSNRLLPAVYP